MRFPRWLFPLLFISCATVRPDDRIEVDASLIAETPEGAVFRVVVQNTSGRALTVERVEVQAIRGPEMRGAWVNPRETLAAGQRRAYTVSAEIAPREQRRRVEEIGGPAVIGSTHTSLGKAAARIYVTFIDGGQRTTGSYK